MAANGIPRHVAPAAVAARGSRRASGPAHRLASLAFAALALALAALVLAALALAPTPASAQDDDGGGDVEQGDQLRVLSVFEDLEYGRSAFVTGRLLSQPVPRGPAEGYGGRTLTLLEQPFGTAAFIPVATTVTDYAGNYSFLRGPRLTTAYRVVSSDPPLTSEPVSVAVHMRLRVSVSDRRPARGGLVTFSGSVTPSQAGRPVQIQRRTAKGEFRTIARTRLRGGGGGRERGGSSYSRRVRIGRSGVYKVHVPAARPGLAAATSDGQRINVR